MNRPPNMTMFDYLSFFVARFMIERVSLCIMSPITMMIDWYHVHPLSLFRTVSMAVTEWYGRKSVQIPQFIKLKVNEIN